MQRQGIILVGQLLYVTLKHGPSVLCFSTEYRNLLQEKVKYDLKIQKSKLVLLGSSMFFEFFLHG